MSMMNKATLPMLVSNWIFGMGIIEYPPGNEYRTISFLYSSICLLGYCALAAYSYPYFLSMSKEFEASPAILKVMFYSNLFITTGTIVSGWKRSKGMRLMILQIRNVDLLLEKIGVTVKYSKQFRIQLGIYIVRILFILILILINWYSFLSRETLQTAEKLAILTLINYPAVLIFVVDSTFVNFIICALLHFRKLNATLRQMLTSSEDFPQHKRVITAHLEKKISQFEQLNCVEVDATYTLSTAKEAHLELVYLCKRADETFDSHIIQTIIVTIAVTTGCLYQIFILLPCIKIDVFDVGGVLLHNGTWVFYYILKIFIFSNGCAAVVQEATATGDIISEFYDEPSTSSTDKTKEVIREFHCHLIRNVISFNPYGFIKIDFTLIKAVLGSVTTYLVIFSQFGNFIVPNYNNSTCI